jgi:aromatic ring-cleaving dioxygenase
MKKIYPFEVLLKVVFMDATFLALIPWEMLTSEDLSNFYILPAPFQWGSGHTVRSWYSKGVKFFMKLHIG